MMLRTFFVCVCVKDSPADVSQALQKPRACPVSAPRLLGAVGVNWGTGGLTAPRGQQLPCVKHV